MEKSRLSIPADQVHDLVVRYLPSHGIDVVVDLQKSQGSDLVDARSGQSYLDVFSFFATNPLGFNHPHMISREVIDELGQAALHKPSNSDSYTREMAQFLETFVRLAKPDFMKHVFFIEGGVPGKRIPGDSFSTGLSWTIRLHPFSHQHLRPSKDPVLSQL